MWLGCGFLTVGGGGLLEDDEVDGSGMLPGPVITFALGLYDVTTWSGSHVDDGTGYVFISCWEQEQHFLAGVLALVGLLYCGLYQSAAFGSVPQQQEIADMFCRPLRMSLGNMGCAAGEALCSVQIVHWQMQSAISALMLGQYTASLACTSILSIP